MEDLPKRTPVKIKRTPVKIEQRTPVQIAEEHLTKESDTPAATSVFGGMAPPQQKIEEVGGLDLTQITPSQLNALKAESFALWAMHSHLEVDNKPLNFDRHRYLLPMYLDDSRELVLMKAAQMGATIWMLLRLLHFCLFNKVKACLYFPTQDGVGKLSKDRLTPLIHSNEELSHLVKDTDTIGYKKIGKHSSLYLQHMGGEATKDSTPFDMICFDEVRLLNPADIDQARERISHSEYKRVMQVSTAGYPGTDVHRAFLGGTQNYFHVKCGCPDGFIPSECWPDCMAVTDKEVYLRCPRCGMKITDNQNGQFVPHNPSAGYPSYHISQLLSKYISPAEIWDNWQRTQNIKEFYNAKLGKPYVDEENQPVKDEDLEACENSDLLWGPSVSKFSGRIQRAMGIDQMSGNNYIVIAERQENKKRIVHYEIVDNKNKEYWEAGKMQSPFKRCHQLMKEYDIDMCLIDAMPNVNEAIEFAQTFPGRVFVCWYIEQQRDMVQWGDRPKHKMTVKKGGPRIKFKYSCFLSRYMSIDFALSEIVNRNVEWPIPERLIQVCRSMESGLFEPLHIFRTHFYKHMKSIARQKTILDEATGRFKMEWVNLGLDPHSCHAWNLCNIAIERLRRVPIVTFV